MASKSRSFNDSLQFGAVGENVVGRYRQAKGCLALPVHKSIGGVGHGPQLLGINEDLVAPDFLVWGKDGTKWVEVKHKTTCTWHRKTRRWQTGVDRTVLTNYGTVSKETNSKVVLCFWHPSDKPDPRDLAWGSPKVCPTGLFVGDVLELEKPGCGRYYQHVTNSSGMVYWDIDSLTLEATVEEVLAAVNGKQ